MADLAHSERMLRMAITWAEIHNVPIIQSAWGLRYTKKTGFELTTCGVCLLELFIFFVHVNYADMLPQPEEDPYSSPLNRWVEKQVQRLLGMEQLEVYMLVQGWDRHVRNGAPRDPVEHLGWRLAQEQFGAEA